MRPSSNLGQPTRRRQYLPPQHWPISTGNGDHCGISVRSACPAPPSLPQPRSAPMTLAGTFYRMHSFQGKQLPSTRLEASLYDAEIIGEVPREINGALYRVGGDRDYPTLENAA